MKKWATLLVFMIFLAIIVNYSLPETKEFFVVESVPITPNDEFFNSAVDFFDIDPDEYRLTVTGAVVNNLSLTLAEIRAMPVTSEIVRMTCVDYKRGATHMTGVANFTGVRLSYILDLAEVKFVEAKDISFHTPNPRGYSTSLNTEQAFWEDVILAYEMNEETMPVDHGFPIKLVCPRFFGYKWIKWLASIIVETSNYRGMWESLGYSDSPFVDVNLPIYYTVTDTHYTVTDTPTNATQSTWVAPTDLYTDSGQEDSKSIPWMTLDVLILSFTAFIASKYIMIKHQKRKKG